MVGGLRLENEELYPEENTSDLYIANMKNHCKITILESGDVMIDNDTTQVELEKGGDVNITTENNVNVNSPTTTIDSGTINLGGSASEKLVLGSSFKPIFENHTHPYSWSDPGGSGMTDPPPSSCPISGVSQTG